MALRKKNKDKENYIFCEFENLAKNWGKRSISPHPALVLPFYPIQGIGVG